MDCWNSLSSYEIITPAVESTNLQFDSMRPTCTRDPRAIGEVFAFLEVLLAKVGKSQHVNTKKLWKKNSTGFFNSCYE